MRVLLAALGGLVLGAAYGLAWFLVILFMPGNAPVDLDGAGSVVTLLFIAAVFVAEGGGLGGLLGLLLGVIYSLMVPTTRQLGPPPRIVSPTCPECGRHATIHERAVSALCRGCGERLPQVPGKLVTPEL